MVEEGGGKGEGGKTEGSKGKGGEEAAKVAKESKLEEELEEVDYKWKVLCTSLCLMQDCHVPPVVAFTGCPRAGKTTTVHLIIRALCGSDVPQEVLPSRDSSKGERSHKHKHRRTRYTRPS